MYLWERVGIPGSVAAKYERRLVELFGDEVSEGGIPVIEVARQWKRFSAIVQETAQVINHFVGRIGPAGADVRGSRTRTALEGMVSEQRVYRRSRSRSRRDQALRGSEGRCACCDTS